MRAGGIYYYNLLWTSVKHNRKDPGKTPFTNSQDISLGYNFLRQENSFFGAWKSWTIYTPTNTTAKNGSRLTVVEADDGAKHFLRSRSGFVSEKHCLQTGYLS